MANLFRQAKQLLDKKDAGSELTEEELGLVNTAIIPLMLPCFPSPDITIGEGLEKLAQMVATGTGKPMIREREPQKKRNPEALSEPLTERSP